MCVCKSVRLLGGLRARPPKGLDDMLSGQACAHLLINGKPISVSMLLISQVVKSSACYLPAVECTNAALSCAHKHTHKEQRTADCIRSSQCTFLFQRTAINIPYIMHALVDRRKKNKTEKYNKIHKGKRNTN